MAAKPFQDLYVGIGVTALAAVSGLVIIPAGIVIPAGRKLRALSPDFWPTIIVGILAAAGISILLQGLIRIARNPEKKPLLRAKSMTCEVEHAPDELPWGKAHLRVLIVLLVLFLIYFSISCLGLVGATIPAICFLCRYGGEKRWKVIIPLSVLLPLALYMFFVHVANVPIPNGLFQSLGQ